MCNKYMYQTLMFWSVFFVFSRESASSADENSCSGIPSPMKKKTKYQIPSDDHTYVRQKSSLLSDSSEHSQSQGQSQEGVTLTSPSTSATPASMVTTLELHSEQTSSQQETLTTTKCPEQVIDQNKMDHREEPPAVNTSELKHDVTDDVTVKKEPEKIDTAEAEQKAVAMDTNTEAAVTEDNKDKLEISRGELVGDKEGDANKPEYMASEVKGDDQAEEKGDKSGK